MIEVALFGPVLRDDFSSDSDVDILLTFAPDRLYRLLQWSRMHDEMEAILGYKVDLSDKLAVEQSHNYIRKNAVLETYQVIYAP